MTAQMKMTQQMKLAPRMIQSMEVLQLPWLGLLERIETELNNNPVLESAEPQGSDSNTGEQIETADSDSELVISEDNNKLEEFNRLSDISTDFDDYLYRTSSVRRADYSEEDKKLLALQNTPDRSKSLHEYLSEQWRLVEADEKIKAAGSAIIDFIDDRGYLMVRLEQLCSKDKHQYTLEHLTAALELVQKLDPPGVGAADIKECLLIQMAQSSEDYWFEQKLIREFMDEILANRLLDIAKKLNCSVEDINKSLRRMRKFDTSPGLQITPVKNAPVKADVIITENEQGGINVSLADMSLPTLRINRFYSQMVRDKTLDSKTKEYLKNNIRSAHWLMDAIEQRKNTLLRVASAAVAHQQEYFKKGKLFLKPLSMGQIAEEIGVHIATVSRAVSGKYIQSPQGLGPLRSLFTHATLANSGDADSESTAVVKEKLRQIIAAEDKSRPFSDEQLRLKLEKLGVEKIARRTVAKYRKMMNIPTTKYRKKF